MKMLPFRINKAPTQLANFHPAWRKSSQSLGNGNCVEVAGLPGGFIGVRDSKDRNGPVLRFTRGEWDAFLGGARNGEFDGIGAQGGS